jgi:hypothetical protein
MDNIEQYKFLEAVLLYFKKLIASLYVNSYLLNALSREHLASD